MNNVMIGVLAIMTTVTIYIITKWTYKKFPNPFTLPIFISTLFIIAGLLLLDVSYDTYYIGVQWLERLLGPAVVALAYPLYQQRHILKENAIPVLLTVTVGSIVGVSSGLIMGKMLGFERLIVISLLPKSVTSPVAMDIAQMNGGSPTLAAVMVMVAGISGAVFGSTLFRVFKVDHYLAKGLGMGSASHAIGTAKAMENNMKEGAVSTMAMVLSAIIVSFITPILVVLLM
jgi:predicted murein hydrolase (TIGR00659 family)